MCRCTRSSKAAVLRCTCRLLPCRWCRSGKPYHNCRSWLRRCSDCGRCPNSPWCRPDMLHLSGESGESGSNRARPGTDCRRKGLSVERTACSLFCHAALHGVHLRQPDKKLQCERILLSSSSQKASWDGSCETRGGVRLPDSTTESLAVLKLQNDNEGRCKPSSRVNPSAAAPASLRFLLDVCRCQ